MVFDTYVEIINVFSVIIYTLINGFLNFVISFNIVHLQTRHLFKETDNENIIYYENITYVE